MRLTHWQNVVYSARNGKSGLQHWPTEEKSNQTLTVTILTLTLVKALIQSEIEAGDWDRAEQCRGIDN